MVAEEWLRFVRYALLLMLCCRTSTGLGSPRVHLICGYVGLKSMVPHWQVRQEQMMKRDTDSLNNLTGLNGLATNGTMGLQSVSANL